MTKYGQSTFWKDIPQTKILDNGYDSTNSDYGDKDNDNCDGKEISKKDGKYIYKHEVAKL